VETNLKIDFCSFDACKYAVKHWHYSKRLQQGKSFKLGVWEDDRFIGCVVFAQGNNPDLGMKYNIGKYEICELSRVALNKHKAPVSKIISIAIKILKENNPKLKLIISFADSNQNHYGTIYQAGNWVFAGETSKSIIWVFKGKEYHTRSVSASGFIMQFGKKVPCLKPSQCKKNIQKPKYRYLYPLTKEMRKQILKLAKPYPKDLKCVSSVNGSTSSFQDERKVQIHSDAQDKTND
jgi:hypothetical protein